MPSVSLAILNYNGRYHLEHLLPTAVKEAERFGPECEVVIVDNRSPDDDARWVKENFPSVKVWTAPQNDYLFSYNSFAAESKSDVLVFLNNDLKLQPGFLAPLIRHFSDPDVFAVGATSMDWEGRRFTCGLARLLHENGFYRWPYDCDHQELSHTLFTSGGFMAVNRGYFLDIGGFDRLYHPAYCEDLDLCFRAWRRGWKCIFEPASVVLHRENGSWEKSGFSHIDHLSLRNSLIFQWSSLPMKTDRWARRLAIIKILAGTLVSGNIEWIKTFTNTLAFWNQQKTHRIFLPTTTSELSAIQKAIASSVDADKSGVLARF